MRKFLGVLLLALFFSADLFAQERPVDSIAEAPEQTDSRKFESLFFDGIKEKAVENYDKAITIFKKCREINPEEGIIYVELAKSYAAIKNLKKAEENFNRALNYLPEERQKAVKINLYQLYKARQKPAEALKIAEQLSNNPYYQLEKVKIYQLLGKYDLALQELENLKQKDRFYTEFYKYRYEIYQESNDQGKAIAFYQNQINQENETDVWNYCKLIEFLVKAEQLQKALQTADELAALNTGNSKAWQCLSAFYINADKKEKATSYVKKILADKYIDEKIKVTVLERYRRYAARYPELESELISMLNNALKMEKSAASNLENALYYENKNQQKALKFFRLALKDQPNNFKLLKKLSLLELKSENDEQAREVAQQGQSLFPGQAIFYYVAGESYFNSQDYKKAISHLEDGLMYIYDNPGLEKQVKKILAKAYQSTGNEKRAKELLQEVKNISE